MGDVLGNRGLAQADGADQDGVAGGLQKLQAHQLRDGGAIALFGPVQVEVSQGLEAPEMGTAQTPPQAAPAALGFLPGQQGLDSGTVGQIMPMGQKAMEMQVGSASPQGFNRRHGRPP